MDALHVSSRLPAVFSLLSFSGLFELLPNRPILTRIHFVFIPLDPWSLATGALLPPHTLSASDITPHVIVIPASRFFSHFLTTTTASKRLTCATSKAGARLRFPGCQTPIRDATGLLNQLYRPNSLLRWLLVNAAAAAWEWHVMPPRLMCTEQSGATESTKPTA